MIATLISLYAAGTLTFGDAFGNATAPAQHTMPWSDNKLLEATPVPERNSAEISPVIKAKAAIAVDLENGLVLYEKNIHDPLPIASLTKLMTAVIVLEENDLKDVVKVSKDAAKTEGSKIWLAPDEKITVEDLLYAVMIPSANDAAVALAENNSETEQKFVGKMNKKALELGLIGSNFINATGLDMPARAHDTGLAADAAGTIAADGKKESKNSTLSGTQETLELLGSTGFGFGLLSSAEMKPQTENFSTAYDLTLLARYAYGKSFVRRAAVKKELEISSVNGDLKHQLKNTNDLLGSYLKVLGLKTGTTDDAGECLISIIENDQGHDILTVVLNSPSRYNETKILADWVFRAYKWT